MAQILDGKQIAEKRKEKLKSEVTQLKEHGITPRIAVILIGETNPSAIYVKHKKRTAAEIGIETDIVSLSDNVEYTEVAGIIKSLNEDKNIHGILLQLPVPPQIDKEKFNLFNLINPKKDIDGLTPFNAGRLLQGHQPYFVAATAKAVHTMLTESNIEIAGKHIVIIGRSIIVGRPLASLMLTNDATVTLVHTKTQDLKTHTQQADILVAAAGNPEFITPEYVKEGAIVVDVGINVRNGKTVGDVLFEEVKNKASYISPVPKGVGPLTIISLLENSYEAALLAYQ